MEEEGENVEDCLNAIDSLRTDNGLLNCVLIPGICDENDPEITGIKVAVEKVFAKRLNLRITNVKLLHTVKDLTCHDKVK